MGVGMSRIIVVCTAVVVGSVCANLSAQKPGTRSDAEAKLPQQIEEVLIWLPTETETLFVAQVDGELVEHGKRSSRTPDQKQPQDAGKMLEATLSSIPVLPLFELNDGTYLRPLAGHKVKFAIEGSCQFRPVRKGPVSVTMYAGCHIFIFDDDLGGTGDSLMRSLLKDADATESLAGHKVARFEKRINDKDTQTRLFTRPKPDVLLFATDRAYLLDLLRRMSGKPQKRAFPKDLPHWKQLDPKSRYWAIRRYERKEQDDAATGFVFSYSPNDARQIRFREIVATDSSMKTSARILRKTFRLGESFGIDPPVEPSVREISPGVIEMTLLLKDASAVYAFGLLLYVTLGHAFSI